MLKARFAKKKADVAKTNLVQRRGLTTLTSKPVLRVTNVEVIRLDTATPILDSKLTALITTCVKHPHVTSVNLQVNYINLTSLKTLQEIPQLTHSAGQAVSICNIGG